MHTLIKIEKDACPACNQVGAFLDDTEVAYETLNIHSADTKEANTATNYLRELSLFTVPVTLVIDEEGAIVDYARGFDTPKLDELVSRVK